MQHKLHNYELIIYRAKSGNDAIDVLNIKTKFEPEHDDNSGVFSGVSNGRWVIYLIIIVSITYLCNLAFRKFIVYKRSKNNSQLVISQQKEVYVSSD